MERSLRAIKLATEQAKAVNEAAADDGNDLSDALLRVVQQKAFMALTKMNEADTDRVSFASLAKIASDLQKPNGLTVLSLDDLSDRLMRVLA